MIREASEMSDESSEQTRNPSESGIAEARTPKSWRRVVRSPGFLALAVIVVVLVLARLMLPAWATRVINGRLDRIGDYHGRIESVDIDLWRSAYEIHALKIVKRTGTVPVPLLDAPRIDIELSWSALLHGGIVGRVVFSKPEINLVDAKGSGPAQSGAGVDWRHQLERLMPIRLDEVRVEDGTLRFRNFTSSPEVDLVAHDIDGVVTNLSNVRSGKDARSASLRLDAKMLGAAPVESHARFDPFRPLRDFEFAIKVRKVELPRGNDFLQAYLDVDAEKGEGEFLMELDAHKGRLEGYAKPLFRHVSLFDWKHDVEEQHDNPLRVLWESLANGIENLFKNQSKDQFATRIPISGEIGDVETNAWQAIVAILHNAFVRALRPEFEHLPKRGPSDEDGE